MDGSGIELLPETENRNNTVSLDYYVVRAAMSGVLGMTNADRLLAYGDSYLSQSTERMLREIADGDQSKFPQHFNYVAPALRSISDFEEYNFVTFNLMDASSGKPNWRISPVLTSVMPNTVQPESEINVDDDFDKVLDAALVKRGGPIVHKEYSGLLAIPASWPYLLPLELHTELQAPLVTDQPRPELVKIMGQVFLYFSRFDPMIQNRTFRSVMNQAVLDYDLV